MREEILGVTAVHQIWVLWPKRQTSRRRSQESHCYYTNRPPESVWSRFFSVFIRFWPNVMKFLFSPPRPGQISMAPQMLILNQPSPTGVIQPATENWREATVRLRWDAENGPSLCQTSGIWLTRVPVRGPDSAGPWLPGFTCDLEHGLPQNAFYKLSEKVKSNYGPDNVYLLLKALI